MNSISALGPLPSDLSRGWPGQGTPWIVEPRKSAPGVDGLLAWATEKNASRIHFHTGHPPWIRVYGRNYPVAKESLDENEMTEIVNHLYSSDGSARLQGGEDFDILYVVTLGRGKTIRFRINGTASCTSRREGANVVMRPIPDVPPSLEIQRVEPEIMDAYRPDTGMVIVSGGTGSGKTTLIAGFNMTKLLDPNGNYNIIEGGAPIEYLLDRFKYPSSTIVQHEIPKHLGSFNAFIRGCMRREPTDIVVSECRDSVTMEAGVQAAISGHLLTTTIHSDDGPSTLQRIVSLTPPGERDNLTSAIGQTLRLIINQRLAPSVDGRRVALREFLVFDRALRTKFLATHPSDWPTLARESIDRQGQSYAVAIGRALDQGLISPDEAGRQRRQVG